MAFDNIRRLASPSAYSPIGTDPMEPPTQGPGVSPITPNPDPIAATTGRGVSRANRMRDFLMKNPERRPSPMGRRADGSIAYDASIYGQNYGAGSAVTAGRQISPGAFNGANPAMQPYSAVQTPEDQYQFTAPRPRGFGGG